MHKCNSSGEIWRGRSPSDFFPQDRLRRFEENSVEGQFAAFVDSMFDIAWYTLAHLMTEEPMLKAPGTRETNLKGIMAT